MARGVYVGSGGRGRVLSGEGLVSQRVLGVVLVLLAFPWMVSKIVHAGRKDLIESCGQGYISKPFLAE